MSDEATVDRALLQGVAAGIEILTAGAQASAIQRAQMEGKIDGYGIAISGLLKTVEGNGEGLKSRVAKLELQLGFLEKTGTASRSTWNEWLKIIIGAIIGLVSAFILFKFTKQ